MKLLREYYELCDGGICQDLLTEAEKRFVSNGGMILSGVIQRCGVPNGNGRIYTEEVLKREVGLYEKLVLIRSAVPTRDIGFLPGNEKEKASVYEEPYKDICIELFQRGDAYQILKTKGLVHFMTTSFIRGVTLRNATIIIDECQNMSFHELDSIITRVGQECRIIFCGDFRQADLQKNGLRDFIRILKAMECFDIIDFEINDIVRSNFVKDYIIAKEQLGL